MEGCVDLKMGGGIVHSKAILVPQNFQLENDCKLPAEGALKIVEEHL